MLLIVEIISERVVTKAFKALLEKKLFTEFVVEKVKVWSTNTQGWRNGVSWHLQEAVAHETGGTICKCCQWVIFPDERHFWCENQILVASMGDDELLVLLTTLRSKVSVPQDTSHVMDVSAVGLLDAVESEVRSRDLDQE